MTAVEDYYNSIGQPMPLHVNPAEFLLETVNVDFATDRDAARGRLGELQTAWSGSAKAAAVRASIDEVEQKNADGVLEVGAAEKKPSSPSLILTLLHRSFIKSYRDVVVYGIRYAMYFGE